MAGSDHRSRRRSRSRSLSFLWPKFLPKGEWGRLHWLISFLAVVLFTGGASRPDVASLTVLRPLAFLMLAAGLLTLRADQVRRHAFLFGFALALILLTAVYLIPLPYGLWSSLPGHALIAEIDRAVGLGEQWRPASMSPWLTANALYALSVPLAVLVHGVQLRARELRQLGLFFIIACGVSCFFAVLQLLGGASSAAYLYRISNLGAAVGLFANRNHQALLLAASLPILAAYAAPRGRAVMEDRRRLFIAIGVALVVVPLLLVTGSRAGAVVGCLALLTTPFIYRCGVRIRKQRASGNKWWGLGALIAVAVIGVGTVLSGRAEALRRLWDTVPGQELRYEKWIAALDTFRAYLPFGSGVGTYEEVFAVGEPASILASSYSNHAHNDWLEVYITAGYPGALLMLLAAGAFVFVAFRQIGRKDRGSNRAYGLAAISVLLIIGVASAVDYPLRTPIIATLFVVACLWIDLERVAREERAIDGQASSFRSRGTSQ